MNQYNKEQFDTILSIQNYIKSCPSQEIETLKSEIDDYIKFREKTADFLETHFSKVCTLSCYKSKLSACCSKEGIITYFADVVINLLYSNETEIEHLKFALLHPNQDFKCVYLGEKGCLWNIKPIVCEMFLCDNAQNSVFQQKPFIHDIFQSLRKQEKTFTWPDKPVLFDNIEKYFINAGLSSPLMYMHNSPGLMRIKKIAGL